MRLLLTGSSGFIGRNMLLATPQSWDVIALYRPGNTSFEEFIADHSLGHVTAVACDLTDADQVATAARLHGHDVDVCLYLASNTSIPDSIRHPVADLTTNVVALLNVLQNWTCHHLVYMSSGAVYIGLNGLVSPESFVAPSLPYAVSKLAAEHYVRAFTKHRESVEHATILRFFGAYGPYEPERKLYTRLVRRFAFECNPHYTVIGDGNNLIDAMYVDDAIRALRAVIDTPPGGLRTVDLGVGGGESVNQVVTRAARAFGLEPEIAYEGNSPEYITFHIDPSKFTSLYGVSAMTPLEQGLHRLADHLAGRNAYASQ